MILRLYQGAARQAVYAHLRVRDDNPCVVIPTGGGKTPLLAAICQDAVALWNGRVLILAHVKELLQQAADKLNRTCPQVRFGVYSAGLKRRDTDAPVIIAGIQSVYKRACELGSFDLILVDEAHLIPLDGDGMYRQFLADARVVNPHLRVVGFTATAFRLDSGPICTPDGILNHVCYEVGVRELIRDGYLCPPISKAGRAAIDTSNVSIRAGEFVAAQVEGLMDQDGLVEAACSEIVECTSNRNAVLIFASGVKHGEHVVQVLKHNHGIDCGFVTGETPADERDRLLTCFKAGEMKYLCNVNVLTTGFDAPNIDCVVLLRPTISPGLYYQMVGRGFRLHPVKEDCLVLDFGGNVLRHGPVDQLRVKGSGKPGAADAPAKECPECHALIATGYALCPQCGFVFPLPERARHEARASHAGILSGQVSTSWVEVEDVFYRVHQKRFAEEDSPQSMRVDYRVGPHQFKTEWICFEHTGYARAKAVAWWQQRSPDPVPATAERAVELAECGAIALPTAICVRSVAGETFERIIDHRLGPLPEAMRDDGSEGPRDSQPIPF